MAAVLAWALFDTPIGACGIAWSEDGIRAVQLPGSDEEAVRSRLRRLYPDASEQPPSPEIKRVIDAVVALLSGERVDFTDVPLDMSGVSPFERRVYDVARAIPAGETLTYGQVARRIGEPGAAQAVGKALGRNSVPIIVPCHRVLGADGKIGGFSAPGGVATKLRILTIEKARTNKAPALFDDLPLAVRPER